MYLIERNIEKLNKLCEKHKVSKLYAFGSVLNESFKGNSDIDFLVTFHKIKLREYADNYFDLKFSLEDLFNRDIDLLEEKALNNPYLKDSIESSKELIYG